MKLVIALGLALLMGCMSRPQQDEQRMVPIAYYKLSENNIDPPIVTVLEKRGISTAGLQKGGWASVYVAPNQVAEARSVLLEMGPEKHGFEIAE